jgi:hypothetical protein
MRPKLLLLDEPTEGIQPSIIKDIGRAITYLRSLGRWRSCWSSNISTSPASSATISRDGPRRRAFGGRMRTDTRARFSDLRGQPRPGAVRSTCAAGRRHPPRRSA